MGADCEDPAQRHVTRAAWYSVTTYIVLALVVVYVAIGQVLIAGEAGTSLRIAGAFTGTPRVVQSADILRLRFVRGVESIELIYRDPLAGETVALSSDSPDIAAHWDGDAPRVLTFSFSAAVTSTEPTDGASPRAGTFIEVEARMGRAFVDDRPASREITDVFVDGQLVAPYDLLLRFLDRDRSTLVLHYPLAIGNISREVAHRAGPYLLIVAMGSLLSLALCQLILLLLTWWWRPDTVKHYLGGHAPAGAVPLVDRLSSELAIPLGLFGTIIGIWLALEQPGITYASFGEVLSILRFAIFSTVLGFGTKMLCRLRGSWAEEVTR